ncbi:MAG: hypothetical protein P0111_18315 [Nitrospira sp.]|nr:hypothetical protein [Nitrospira sp.]
MGKDGVLSVMDAIQHPSVAAYSAGDQGPLPLVKTLPSPQLQPMGATLSNQNGISSFTSQAFTGLLKDQRLQISMERMAPARSGFDGTLEAKSEI